MPDVYEKYCYETDPLNPDTDGDSLPDGFEIKISYTDPLSKDTNENGIPDNQEDPDSDKLTNYEEYIEKTDPLKPDTDEDELLDGDEVHEYHTDPLKPDTDDDHVEDGDEILLQTNPNDNTDGDTIVTQSMSEDELDVNDDNDDFKISLKLEVSNNLKKYIKQNESLYTGMLSDNRSIIAYPVYIGYEAGEVKSGTISFRLSDNLLTKRPHYYKDLNLGIERYGIFTYDKKLRTIVPVPCSYNNDTITVDAKYMGDLIVMDYESLMYDNGIVPGASQDDPEMRQVDLVLVVDTTGSMGGQISAVKKNLSQIISKLREDGISLYVSIVDYRDITCDGEDSTKVNNNSGIDFYNSSSDISAVINSLSVGNGGDEPECTIDALGKALYLDYRNGASKYAFVITDASYKIDNNFEIKNMEEVAQSLEARGVITSVITSTSLYDCYNELTTITGGENISIDGDFCDDMYEVIYSKTAKTSVFLGNNIVSGSFKEPLVYGGSCDTDEDTISDSDEIDWDNVKQINADGTYELYTWGEMYARSSMADAEAVNPLFNYVSKIHVLPAISNPFSADSDNDYYPDDVDDNCFEEDDMYIEDDVLDDSHLHDDEEMDDSEEEINDFEEEMSVELCALKAKSNEIKISDGKIKQPKGGEANSLLFTRKIRKGKSDKFSLTPTKRSYYRFNVAGAESYKIKVTYTTGILCFKKTHTEKKQSDGTYLLQPERKYQITIKCEGKGNYIFSIRKDNWVYAPNGGVVSEPYMDFGGNSVLHDYTSVYIPEKTIQKICSIINFSEKNDKDFKEVFIRNMECRFFTSKSENKIKAEVKKASDSVSIATTFAGVVLMFVPEAKVLGIVTTSIGGVTTATSLMLTKSTSRLDEFSSTLRRAISKNNYNICVTSSRYGNLFSSTSLECSSWKNRYIYKFNPLGKPWNVKVGVTPKDVSKAFK